MLASLAEMLAGATTLRHFWEPTWELFWSMIRRAFRSISILSIGILSIGILVNRHFGQSTFWSIGILVNRHFGQSAFCQLVFWSIGILSIGILSIGILVNRHFVNPQSCDFSEGWPKPHSVNPQFGQSGADDIFKNWQGVNKSSALDAGSFAKLFFGSKRLCKCPNLCTLMHLGGNESFIVVISSVPD